MEQLATYVVKRINVTLAVNKGRRCRVALYTIGDLHLSLGSNKPMDIFGERWQNMWRR